MEKILTQKEAYKLGTEKQFIDSIDMGPWATYNLLNDPKHMLFSLSRYKFVAKMFDGLNNIIEIGCGDAFGTPIMAQHVKKILAIDTDLRHIKSNKKRLKKIKNIKFVKGTIQELGLSSNTFDGVFSIDVIEHLEKKFNDVFVKKQADLLKDHGVCIIGTPNITASEYASETSRVQHINMHSQRSLKKLMSKFFKQVFMFGMNDEVLHTGYASMCHYIFGLGIK